MRTVTVAASSLFALAAGCGPTAPGLSLIDVDGRVDHVTATGAPAAVVPIHVTVAALGDGFVAAGHTWSSERRDGCVPSFDPFSGVDDCMNVRPHALVEAYDEDGTLRWTVLAAPAATGGISKIETLVPLHDGAVLAFGQGYGGDDELVIDGEPTRLPRSGFALRIEGDGRVSAVVADAIEGRGAALGDGAFIVKGAPVIADRAGNATRVAGVEHLSTSDVAAIDRDHVLVLAHPFVGTFDDAIAPHLFVVDAQGAVSDQRELSWRAGDVAISVLLLEGGDVVLGVAKAGGGYAVQRRRPDDEIVWARDLDDGGLVLSAKLRLDGDVVLLSGTFVGDVEVDGRRLEATSEDIFALGLDPGDGAAVFLEQGKSVAALTAGAARLADGRAVIVGRL